MIPHAKIITSDNFLTLDWHMICLIDGNNFFVSCERVFNPKLHKKPVIVLSSNDGCVISRSNEAKALGIKMAQPLFEIKELVAKENVQIFSSNFQLYNDMSKRMMSVISELSPKIEVYSIDEAFCHLNFIPINELNQYGWQIKNKIKQYIGIPCSVGISHTKVLAKIANKIAKKSKKALGVLALIEEKHIEYALSITAVNDIWGIGKQYSKILNKNKIYTAKEFRDADSKFIQKNLSIVGLRIQKELRKENCLEITELNPPQKSITVSRSFSKLASSLNNLLSPLTYFVSIGCAKLRAQKLETASVCVWINSNRFAKNTKYYSNAYTFKLSFQTSSDFHVLSAAIEGLSKIYREGYLYKKCGISFLDLRPESMQPSNLFDTRNIEEERMLFKTIDQIEAKFGHCSVLIAQGIDYSWKPNISFKSPDFSTDLLQLMKIK